MSDRPGARRHAAAAAMIVMAVAAAVVAGCGGGGESATSRPAESVSTGSTTTSTSTTSRSTTSTAQNKPEPRRTGHSQGFVIDAVLASSDPNQVCSREYVTEHYLNVGYGGEEGCVKAQRPGNAAQSLGMSEPKPPSNGRVTWKVEPKGGIYDGERLTVTLVRENGTWKIDALKSNAPVGP